MGRRSKTASARRSAVYNSYQSPDRIQRRLHNLADRWLECEPGSEDRQKIGEVIPKMLDEISDDAYGRVEQDAELCAKLAKLGIVPGYDE